MASTTINKIARRENGKLVLDMYELESVIENIFDECRTKSEIEFVFDNINSINEVYAERKIDDLQNS